jgi:tetratricopeptide (TPR) repeat protein
MKAVANAVEAGRCSVAVSSALLRDPEVMLALKDRAALAPMALSGPATAPVTDVGEQGVARAVANPNGVLVLVEPEMVDQSGLEQIGKLLGRASNKPTVYVVSRQYNPFQFGMLRGLKVQHIKGRGKSFLQDLPVPADEALPEVELPKTAKKKASDNAPIFTFVGRDEEVDTLAGILGTGGPVVVSGPHGIGKRYVVEHAFAKVTADDADPKLTVLPELTLGRGIGFDTLVARLALVCKEAGNTALADAAASAKSTPADIVKAAIESLQAVELNQVMLVEGLHTALGRQGDFFRKSRLEMLLTALLTHTYSLRIVFTSVELPTLYREGAGKHLRTLELKGIGGKFLYEIFQGYKAPEFPRDRIGPMNERIHGHPMATRTYAVEVRERPDGVELTDHEKNPKFMKMGSIEDTDVIKKRIGKRVDKLGKKDRAALAMLAHLPRPVDGQRISNLGLARRTRLHLLGQGLLDMVGLETDRGYRVHPLVRGNLSWRETSDFDVYGRLADDAWNSLKGTSGMTELVIQQDLNQFAVASRNVRRRVKTELPDNDALVESVIGMIRSKRPNFHLAKQRLAEVLNAQPSNADAHLMRLELIQAQERYERDNQPKKGKGRGPKQDASPKADRGRGRGKGRGRSDRNDRGERPDRNLDVEKDDFATIAEEAMSQAPVPEVFHKVTGFWLSRRQRHKAIEILERAVEALPTEARLHCRLGSLLLRHGRRKEAIERLQTAMDLEPMLPDAYGLLGMAKRDEGAEALPEAETLLREAVRLAPDDPVQTARLADLLIHLAAAETDAGKRSDTFAEAQELLETSLRGDRKAPEAQLLLAQLHRRSGGDLERADWLLSKAKKNSERGAERHHRISLERALVMMARGEIDPAEALVRDQAARNPSSHRAFATLAQILEARDQIIPAHAEYLRAKERAPQGSLWAAAYDTELARIQARIEARAAGLADPGGPVTPAQTGDSGATLAAGDAEGKATGNTANRVIRRRRSDSAEPETQAGHADAVPPENAEVAPAEPASEPSDEPGPPFPDPAEAAAGGIPEPHVVAPSEAVEAAEPAPVEPGTPEPVENAPTVEDPPSDDEPPNA